MDNLSHISRNVDAIRARMALAAEKSGRSVSDITLVAVTKTYPAEAIAAAIHAGITDAGENRIQEALPKIAAISSDLSLAHIKWHLIGHLQSNKARIAVENFDLIHSMDSVKLAREINRHAQEANRVMPVLLQVNISGEDTKSGLEPGTVEEAIGDILDSCPNVLLQGFMTMAPIGDPETARPVFKKLRELKDAMLNAFNHPRFVGKDLSMGMSGDYEVAIEEGATLIRVGSSIFGNRS